MGFILDVAFGKLLTEAVVKVDDTCHFLRAALVGEW